MNYYEKIIQEKKNYKIFGMDGDQYESRYISEYARKFADGLKKGLISESQIVTNLIIDYGWSRKNAEKVAEEAKKIARHNSKEEKDNADLVAEESYGKYTIKVFHHGSNRYGYFSYPKGSSMSISYASGNASSEREALDKAKSALDRHNSKEEKDNASVQDKFRHKGCLITILKKSENQYTFTIEQDGREEGTSKVFSTQDQAESAAKREVEGNWNEKEKKGYYQSIIEKKNQIDPDKEMKKLQALKPVVEAFKHKGMTKHEVATRLMQEKNISETLAQQCVDSWY